MELIDINAYRQILGSLIKEPGLFLLYPDISPNDFGNLAARIVFVSIQNLLTSGANTLSVIEVDEDISRYDTANVRYQRDGGIDFLKDCVEYSEPENFKYYYDRLKKLSLLKTLGQKGYDISEYYKPTFETVKEENECIERFDEATVESILNNIEGKLNKIRSAFLNGVSGNAEASVGLREMKERFKESPEIGCDMEGDIFSTVCRGARLGKFYLRSAKSGLGKSRLAFFDAVKIAIPERFSVEEGKFVSDADPITGELLDGKKTLIITTEMAKDEVQTVLLAYLSKVNESKILTGSYFGEEEYRIDKAIEILEKYKNYLFIEEIADPNLSNVSAMIKRYATVEDIQYVFYDYIFASPSLLNQFAGQKVREDSALLMMSTELKELAKKYNIFISSSSQLNATGMEDNGEFKNEMSLRGAKSLADKADMGCIMSLVKDDNWNQVALKLRSDNQIVSKKPNYVFDIYKMRRGQYKNVRIWSYINLGTGERQDLYITTANNEPLPAIDIVKTRRECPF